MDTDGAIVTQQAMTVVVDMGRIHLGSMVGVGHTQGRGTARNT